MGTTELKADEFREQSEITDQVQDVAAVTTNPLTNQNGEKGRMNDGTPKK